MRQLGVELVLTGVQTPEDLFGQLAPYLGATLDWPHVSAVGGVQAAGDGIEVLQEYSGGVSATLRLRLPAVIGVQTASQPPRYVSGSKLRQAMSEPIAVIESDAMPAADTAEILALREPARSGEAVMLEGDAETVADKLHDLLAERGLVKGVTAMGDILVHIETRAGAIQPVSLELLTAARELAGATGMKVEALVAAAAPQEVAARLGAADRVLVVAHPALEPYTPEAHAAILAETVRARDPAIVLLGYSSVGLDLAPNLAVRTGRPLVSYCVKLAAAGDAIEAESLVYGGKLRATTRAKLPAIFAVTPGSYRRGADGRRARPNPRHRAAGRDRQAPHGFRQRDEAAARRHRPRPKPTVSFASAVASATRTASPSPRRSQPHSAPRSRAAARLSMPAGCRRSAKSASRGAKVKPKLYIAAGVSGAPEHLEGMSGGRTHRRDQLRCQGADLRCRPLRHDL